MADLLPALVDSGRQVLAKAKSLVDKAGARADTSLIEQFGGRASDSILAEAEKWKADLIVLGTHGRRGLRRALLGSDAEEVVRNSKVPVLLVRDRTADLPKAVRARARR
jgi:nucleotide-binding universal stress UspA family protein